MFTNGYRIQEHSLFPYFRNLIGQRTDKTDEGLEISGNFAYVLWKSHQIVDPTTNNDKTLTRHAHASESARVVQAGAIVPARVALTLVHVGLAARASEADRTVARERPGRVHADTVVLARRTCKGFA